MSVDKSRTYITKTVGNIENIHTCPLQGTVRLGIPTCIMFHKDEVITQVSYIDTHNEVVAAFWGSPGQGDATAVSGTGEMIAEVDKG